MSDIEHQRDTYRRWWQQVAGERDEARDELRRSRDAHNLAIRERDALQADLDNTVREKYRIEMERNGFRDEVAGFEAMWEQREKAHDAETEALRAQLATAKREGWYEVAQYIQGQSHHPHPTDFGVATSIRAEAENRYPYPATPSGELCDADCGCPSPEAREVPFPARFLVLDHDGKCIGYVPMGCTEARQVVAMAQEARDAE
jgi:hypothetical protein